MRRTLIVAWISILLAGVRPAAAQSARDTQQQAQAIAPMACTCAEPVRSGAAVAVGGVLFVLLSLSATAAFTASAVYLFKKSRRLP